MNNQDKKEYYKQWRAKLKYEVLDHYSALRGKCNPDGSKIITPCCGICQESDLSKLHIDHVEGSGNEHRKALFGRNKGGHHFYSWLKRNNYPEGYQTLCERHTRRKADSWDAENKTRAVSQYDLSGNLITTYPSIREAARRSGCLAGEIWRVCNGERKTTHSYAWRFATPEEYKAILRQSLKFEPITY